MSRELKALDTIKNYQVCTNYGLDEYKPIVEVLPNSFNIIEVALNENAGLKIAIEHIKSVLDVLINKKVYIHALFQCFELENGLDKYNIQFTPSLSEDEYDFLRKNIYL